jgi:hypothetical protein
LEDLGIDLCSSGDILFQPRELCCLVIIVHRMPQSLPGCSSLFQTGVVDLSTYIQLGLEHISLLARWVEPVFESSEHWYLSHPVIPAGWGNVKGFALGSLYPHG